MSNYYDPSKGATLNMNNVLDKYIQENMKLTREKFMTQAVADQLQAIIDVLYTDFPDTAKKIEEKLAEGEKK